MKKTGYVFVLVVIALAISMVAAPENPAPTGVPVHMIATVEAQHGSNLPEVYREDVMVYEGRDRDKVTGWVPLQADQAGLELFILLDDASASGLGSQLEDLRKFILAQPASTRIGVAYMGNGVAQIGQNPTSDHAQAAKALRLPMANAGAGGSPYFSLSDLIKRWPESNGRREVLMVSDGIDRFWGSGSGDPYVDSAIEQAQRAGVIVFAIYTPGAGHYGHTYWRITWGQSYLSQVAEETGGESYAIGFTGVPLSFAPYLEEITHRLGRQYLLTFLAKPEKKAGMQKVKLRTEVPNAELVSADRVYVPAGPQ